MAGEESTATTQDVDTSTNDDVQDTDIALEDIEVSLDEEETEEQDISEPESTEDTEPKDEESEEDITGEEDTSTTEDVGSESEEDKKKAFNKEMAERRIREKQERELSIKQQQEKYLGDAEDDKDLVLRQLQVDAYNNKIESNTNKLTNGFERAIKDFDILSSDSPEIQAEVNSAIDAFQAKYVTLDAYGNPIEVRGDLYKELQTKANSIAQLTRMGARQQEQDKSKERSKVTPIPNRAPKKPKVDPDMTAFDEEASKW